MVVEAWIQGQLVWSSLLLGEAYPDIKEETGIDRYNVKLTFTLPQKEGEEGEPQVRTDSQETNLESLFADAGLCRERSAV